MAHGVGWAHLLLVLEADVEAHSLTALPLDVRLRLGLIIDLVGSGRQLAHQDEREREVRLGRALLVERGTMHMLLEDLWGGLGLP